MTKKCAICGEDVTEGLIKCSKGHSLFVAAREKELWKHTLTSKSAKLIEEMLRRSSNQYTEDEIPELIESISRILRGHLKIPEG